MAPYRPSTLLPTTTNNQGIGICFLADVGPCAISIARTLYSANRLRHRNPVTVPLPQYQGKLAIPRTTWTNQ